VTSPLAAPDRPSPAVSPDRPPPRWPIAAWIGLYAAVAAAIQFGFVSIPFDADTAYHVAVGRLIRAHGLLHAFPWTPFSWLADHYADKELLFHLAFVPLAHESWVVAAKIVGTIAGAIMLSALYLVLRASGVRRAGTWALLPLAASAVFVFRFSIVRPHLLSIALALVVTWAAARGRLGVLAVASALYPWAYVAWHLPVVLAALVEAARALAGERVRWRPVSVAVAGVAAGIGVHPNALNLVRFDWIVTVDVLFRNAWGGRMGFALGDEFQPFSVAEWARWLVAPVAILIGAAVLAWRSRRADSMPLAFALVAFAFFGLTVRTARFAEYFVPFSAAALALAARGIRWRFTAPAVLTACLLYSAPASADLLRGLGEKQERIPAGLAETLRRRIPPGAQVFTCDWGHTGTLMLALPERRFVVALDPTLAYLHDPALYDLFYRLPREAPRGSAETIRRAFGARFVICFWDDWNKRFCDRLAFEPGVQTVAITDFWNVYELGGPADASP
jgi:hypothetical protein